jgi:hypothetical protein
MFEKRPDWVRSKIPFDGKRYGLACTWEGEGEVFSYDENRVILKFFNEGYVTSQVYGIVRLPDFVVNNQNNMEGMRFRRNQRLFRQRFEIRSGTHSIGEIIQQNPICTRYEINFANGIKWNLSLPLFTIIFWFFIEWRTVVVLASISPALASGY